MLDSRTFNERRKFMRFDIHINIEFKSPRETTDYFLGITRNFSREGLGFVSQNFDFNPPETIELRLNLPGKDTFIYITGDMMWKRQVEAKWLAGIKFKEMDKKAKSEILDYAYNMWIEKMRNYSSGAGGRI